jgi:hypothetical protein
VQVAALCLSHQCRSTPAESCTTLGCGQAAPAGRPWGSSASCTWAAMAWAPSGQQSRGAHAEPAGRRGRRQHLARTCIYISIRQHLHMHAGAQLTCQLCHMLGPHRRVVDFSPHRRVIGFSPCCLWCQEGRQALVYAPVRVLNSRGSRRVGP